MNENAMMIEFKKEGIPAVAQFPIKVLYEEEIVGEYYADILIATKVIVEIKAVKNLLTEHACPVKCSPREIRRPFNWGHFTFI